MKLFILALTVAAALARPDVSHLKKTQNDDRQAQIVKQGFDVGVDGKYFWEIETNNGIAAHEHGEQKNANSDSPSASVGGQFSYTDPEGQVHSVSYVADENGYQPQGADIPTPPPVPEAILRSLDYIAAHPPKEERNF